MSDSPSAVTGLGVSRGDLPISPLLARRWSPRDFDPHHRLAADDRRALLEAARWAPSAQNRQPRRFVLAERGSPEHQRLAQSLYERNRLWAADASALLLGVVQREDAQAQQQRFAEYDLGQAIAHLTVEAESRGLRVRQMGGFEATTAADLLGIDAPYEPFVVVAIGALPTGRAPEVPERSVERLPVDVLRIGHNR